MLPRTEKQIRKAEA
jgi:hypothetical protein